jgi:hypothetical protein
MQHWKQQQQQQQQQQGPFGRCGSFNAMPGQAAPQLLRRQRPEPADSDGEHESLWPKLPRDTSSNGSAGGSSGSGSGSGGRSREGTPVLHNSGGSSGGGHGGSHASAGGGFVAAAGAGRAHAGSGLPPLHDLSPPRRAHRRRTSSGSRGVRSVDGGSLRLRGEAIDGAEYAALTSSSRRLGTERCYRRLSSVCVVVVCACAAVMVAGSVKE